MKSVVPFPIKAVSPETNETHRNLSVLLNRIHAAWTEAQYARKQASLAQVSAYHAHLSIDRVLCEALVTYEDFCRSNGLPMSPQHEELAKQMYNDDGEIKPLREREEA